MWECWPVSGSTLVDWHLVQGLLYTNSACRGPHRWRRRHGDGNEGDIELRGSRGMLTCPILTCPVQQSSAQASSPPPSTTKFGRKVRSWTGSQGEPTKIAVQGDPKC